MNQHWASAVIGTLLLLVCVTCGPRELAMSEPVVAAPAPAEPAQPKASYGQVSGVEMLGNDGVKSFALHGSRDKVELSLQAVEGQPFSEALRAKVKEGSPNAWDVQLQTAAKQPVMQGDVMLATFYFRTDWVADESGEGKTEFVFELAREPWTKSISYPVRASRHWKKVHVPFVASDSYQAGEAQVIFRLGYAPQTIELAGVRLENFGKRLALADLPSTKLSYAGMEPGAGWRAEAQTRIDEHRKAKLVVQVTDAVGKPVRDAEVAVELERHAFMFGTCVAANKLTEAGHERYKAALKAHFNIATIENSFKWVALAGDWGGGFSLESAQGAVKWLNDHGLAARGHVLIWPGWRNLPKALRAYEKRPEELRSRVRSHIKELAQATKGSLVHWDVMNEPFDNHDLMDILGKDEMIDWFKLARAADPKAKLYINDYAILSGGGGDSPHRDHYEETIRFLIDGGAPLDGIGLQGHFGTSLTSPDDLLVLLDRYAKFKRPLLVTEYDVVIDDEELAARYTEDFYTLLFSHPAVEGIIMWGFWDAVHWKKNAPLFRQDWSLKPSGKAFTDLVHQRWHTKDQGRTDAQGKLGLRGFLGNYQVSVQHAGRTKSTTGSLGPSGSTITIKLD